MEELMKKKILYGISTLVVCIMLTGCCVSHEWKEATCTEPKTCSKCGKTEGEPLGHTWVDATCAAPKTCSVCGETEGNALEHTWIDATCAEAKHCSVCGETEGAPLEHTLTEANYQQAATCEVCGETVGEPLQADFEKYKLTDYIVQSDQEYDYKTWCSRNSPNTTIGKVKFSNYHTFDSDETHPAQEGYNWKSVDVILSFGDKNAWDYGIGFSTCNEDYYDIVKHDDTIQDTDDKSTFTVNWNGIDYTECCMIITPPEWSDWTDNKDAAYGDWEKITTAKLNVATLVPVDYDGFVYGVHNSALDYQHINELADQADHEDLILFRMQ